VRLLHNIDHGKCAKIVSFPTGRSLPARSGVTLMYVKMMIAIGLVCGYKTAINTEKTVVIIHNYLDHEVHRKAQKD